ncbi:chemotaxis protein, partial [Vibrio parahaemolyticus]|nr:chemotaxis protein [Vibrio parahaemolyticus]
MNFKYLLSSLVILLSVSFSAFADLVMISQLGTATVNECSGYKVGDVVEIGYSADLSGRYGNGLKCKSLLVGGLSVRVEYYNSNGSIGSGSLYVVPYSNKCPDGQVINPDTGKCENPPPPPFCSRPDTISQMNQFESSCLADGGSPTIICNDKVNPPDLRMSCDVPP